MKNLFKNSNQKLKIKKKIKFHLIYKFSEIGNEFTSLIKFFNSQVPINLLFNNY